MRLMRYMFRMTDSDLRVDESDAGWVLGGPAAPRFSLVNEFLGHLADRRLLAAAPCGRTRSTCSAFCPVARRTRASQLAGVDGR